MIYARLFKTRQILNKICKHILTLKNNLLMNIVLSSVKLYCPVQSIRSSLDVIYMYTHYMHCSN